MPFTSLGCLLPSLTFLTPATLWPNLDLLFREENSREKTGRRMRVQNSVARLVLKKRRRIHVTSLLNKLHWLPVKFRCLYKIATLAYSHYDGTLPSYLSASLCTYQTSRTLRSSNEKLLKIRKCNFKSVGDRSFSFIAPTVWNSLPVSLRNLPTLSDFQAQLKTFLFSTGISQI